MWWLFVVRTFIPQISIIKGSFLPNRVRTINIWTNLLFNLVITVEPRLYEHVKKNRYTRCFNENHFFMYVGLGYFCPWMNVTSSPGLSQINWIITQLTPAKEFFLEIHRNLAFGRTVQGRNIHIPYIRIFV